MLVFVLFCFHLSCIFFLVLWWKNKLQFHHYINIVVFCLFVLRRDFACVQKVKLICCILKIQISLISLGWNELKHCLFIYYRFLQQIWVTGMLNTWNLLQGLHLKLMLPLWSFYQCVFSQLKGIFFFFPPALTVK